MKQKHITFSEIFLALLALILTFVSFHQTWLGIEQLFGSAAMPLALVLSLLLLFLDWHLRNAKLDQKPVRGIIAIYIIVAILCFAANFNALYTRFMRTDIYSNELKTLITDFNNLETNITSKLSYKYPQDVATQVESKKKQLIEQIQDPGNPGIGDRAKNIIRDIEKLLNEKIDILSPFQNDYQDLAARMGKKIDSITLNLSPLEAELKNEVVKGVLKANKSLQDLTGLNKKDIDEKAESLIQKTLNDYNKLGGKAQGVFGQEKFKFSPKTSETSEIGKIGYAFRHASEHFGIYPVIVLLGCLVLDFLIPILIVLLVKSDDDGTNNSNVRRKTARTIISHSRS